MSGYGFLCYIRLGGPGFCFDIVRPWMLGRDCVEHDTTTPWVFFA